MAPVAVQTNGANKLKRSAPPDIQTNGVTSMSASPLPSATKPKQNTTPKLPQNSVSERPIASTVRPSNRIRRDTATQAGRNSRNSAGLRSGPLNEDLNAANGLARPHVLTPAYILRKFAGRPPSLVVHLHPQHFRFDGQDGMFSYRSPMSMFLEHLKSRTVPHDILDYLVSSGVPFYDGCLIVQVHDHKSLAQAKDAAKPATKSKAPKISSVHKHNPYVTPSSYAPFAKDESSQQNGEQKSEEDGKASKQEDQEEASNGEKATEAKAPTKPKVFTVVLMPTPESLSRDLMISATTPALQLDGRPRETPVPLPPTPSGLVPPTPTASAMPPPAKRQKREKMEMEPSQLRAAEGQILVAMEAPLVLGPKASGIEAQIVMLEAMAHPKHSEPPPAPKTRKRTVAEMAADEAAAAEQERYMLFLDERPGASGAQATGGADADAQAGAATFEPTFERFKVIAQIKQEHAEKKEQEKIKQQENDRKLQLQRQTQQSQAEAQAQKQQAEAEKAKREAAAQRQAQQNAEAQRQQMAARAAAQNSAQQNNQANGAQGQHGHPQQNAGMQNGMPNNAGGQPSGQANMGGQAQARLQAQMAQAQAQGSSPVVRHGTPQNHSSPMVNNAVPMQQTSSSMAASPPRPSSVVQNPPMAVPMSHNMSARGSQQSHPSNTPRMPHGTPNMPHGTPINRQSLAATPRMSQTSPPPNMMAQNSQMGQNMMMNNPNMAQNPQMLAQMAAQQRAMAAQQHQQGMQGMQQMNGMNMNGQMQGQGQMTPQQQAHMMAMMRNQQMMMQQQQQQNHPQQQPNGMMSSQHIAQQYAQQLQNMQGGGNMRQMSPQMAQMQQQMARMNQMGVNGMQRQMSNQMMNGQNPNMNAFTMQQMHQRQQMQQQQQAQQHHQQQQQRQPQVNPQIQGIAKQMFGQMLNDAAGKFGGPDNIPAEVRETFKNQAMSRATQMWHSQMQRQRQAQAMMQQQQHQQQQQQQQHQAAAIQQNMGGMMGHQGM